MVSVLGVGDLSLVPLVVVLGRVSSDPAEDGVAAGVAVVSLVPGDSPGEGSVSGACSEGRRVERRRGSEGMKGRSAGCAQVRWRVAKELAVVGARGV